MLDWDTYIGSETVHDITIDGPVDGTGPQDWLPAPAENKGALDEFGPMFGSEGGDDGGVTDLPPVDVVADPDPDPYDDWWEVGGSPGAGGNPGTGTGGGSGGSQVGWILGLVKDVLVSLGADWLGDSLSPEERQTRERAVAESFDPTQVQDHYRDELGQYWVMRDGTTYYDRDGNNRPDSRILVGSDGHIYADDGNGWTLIR